MKLNIIPILSLLIISVSVKSQNSNPTIIDFSKLEIEKGSQIKLSDIAESVSYIRLSNAPLIGDVWFSNIYPVDENQFFIFSNGLMHRYDGLGKYMGKLYNSGRGPNEAIVHIAPVLNQAKGQVLVIDYASNSYKVFSTDGKFIEKRVYTSNNGLTNLHTIGYVDNYEFTHTSNDSPRITPESCNPYNPILLEVKDMKTDKIVFRYPNPYANFRYKVISRNFGIDSYPAFCGKIPGKYWFNFRNIDTIYTTSNFSNITPAFVIKPKEPRRTFKDVFMGNNGASDKSKIDHSYIENITLSDRFVFILFGVNGYHSAYYDARSGKTTLFEMIIKNDIDQVMDINMIMLMRQGAVYNNKAYVLIDAMAIVDNGKASKFPGLTENSNPVLMVINLKK